MFRTLSILGFKGETFFGSHTTPQRRYLLLCVRSVYVKSSLVNTRKEDLKVVTKEALDLCLCKFNVDINELLSSIKMISSGRLKSSGVARKQNLTPKNILTDTGQRTVCPGHVQNINCLSLCTRRYLPSVQHMTLRSLHDDTINRNKTAVKRKTEDENVENLISRDFLKVKRKKKDRVKINSSLKTNNLKVVGGLYDNVEKENVGEKSEERGELENVIPREVENSRSEGETNPVEVKELELIKQRYPHPKGTLHNIYATVAQELKDSSLKLESSYRSVLVHFGKSSKPMWSCTYRVRWPSEVTFSSTASSKALASKQAAMKALHWLKVQGKLTLAGAPQLFDPKEIKYKIPMEVIVDHTVLEDIRLLTAYFNQNIEPLLAELETTENTSECSDMCREEEDFVEDEDTNNMENFFGADELTNPITGLSSTDTDPQVITQRNKNLYNNFLRRSGSDSKETSEFLPIAKFRSQIVEMVGENRVVVIKGEPGCGKSTQVPQYVMEHWEAARRGAQCNVIITQPRRISAISLAEWVAHERQEKIGNVVGYQVRLNAALPKSSGALLFCSTGILLKRLQSNPGLFGASHVILDEAHERDINTDMLLVLLRRALSVNPDLHLIIMSATINAELFQGYFDNAPALNIPGFTYPVKSIFLEEMEMKSRMSEVSERPAIDCQFVADVIKWIDSNRPEGAVLCFLPGWADISKVTTLLTEYNSLCVLPVHSRLSNSQQHRIFDAPPPGTRKVILSTNIAETSITINDVSYVVDTGAHKEERLNVQLGMSSLDNQWVSKANVRQRRGRAGRVKPGECFHLYTSEKFNSMDEFPIPELLRVPLEKTVLDLKTYSQDEKAISFLAEMPEPPSAAAVVQAVRELHQLGALDDDENLTALGRRIALFSLHPKISKALVLAAIFKCVSPMLTIATTLSGETNLFVGALVDKENIRMTKRRYHPSSDHIAMVWLYHEWEMINKTSYSDASNFCYTKNLKIESLRLTSKLRKLYSEQLCQSQMLQDSDDYKDLNNHCNKYAGNDEFVKAVLLSGTGSLLFSRNWDVKNGRFKKNTNVILTEAGQRTKLSSASVNFKRMDFPTPFLTCFRQVESSEGRLVTVHESSLLSPLSVLLFSEGICVIRKFVAPPQEEDKWKNHVLLKINRCSRDELKHNKRDVFLLCDKSVVHELVDLRKIVWSMVNYFVQQNGVEEDDERYRTLSSYHNRLLKLLGTMLYEAGAVIEYDKEGNLRQ